MPSHRDHLNIYSVAPDDQKVIVKGSGRAAFRILENEPRVVTLQTIQKLEESGASSDLVKAAKRAAKTNPA